MTLPQLSTLKSSKKEIQVREDGSFELSVYQDDALTMDVLQEGLTTISAVFPKTSEAVLLLTTRLVMKNEFTNQQFRDAIDHLITNYHYPEFKPADILSFDKKVKLYTYSEVSSMVTSGVAEFSDFILKNIGGESFRIKKSDL